MTMNETLFSSPDIMFILAAVAASFALGGAYRLGRTAVRERRAVELTDQDFRALSDRYEDQKRNVSQLTRELSDVRQALMQQAMAMGPVHALRVSGVEPAPGAPAVPVSPPAPAPEVAPAPPAAAAKPVSVTPVRAVNAPRPAASAPSKAARPAAKPRKAATPLELARAGAPADLLMSRCGLSRAEAELVISVHGKQAKTAA
jgi:hypothetical protein